MGSISRLTELRCGVSAAPQNLAACLRAVRRNLSRMSTMSREVIWGGRIMGARIHAEGARGRAERAIREVDRAEAEAWSVYGGLWRARTAVADDRSMPQRRICMAGGRVRPQQDTREPARRRDRDTPLWKLEASLKCRSCRSTLYPGAHPHAPADQDKADHTL